VSEPTAPVSAGIDPGMVAKVASAWAAVGVTSWSELASFLAAIYTAILMAEWFWKRFWRPVFERRGWVKPKRGRRHDDEG
jgi:hypothetical protein